MVVSLEEWPKAPPSWWCPCCWSSPASCAYSEEAADAACRIKRLPNASERAALLLHYVDGKTCERVCVKMDYPWDGIMALRRRAGLNAYEVMPHEWRDPLPPAL